MKQKQLEFEREKLADEAAERETMIRKKNASIKARRDVIEHFDEENRESLDGKSSVVVIMSPKLRL